MSPFLYGGEMIDKVSMEDTTFTILPYKFEAGTPNVEGSIGLAKAVDFLQQIGMNNIAQHDNELTQYALEKMKSQIFRDLWPKNNLQSSIISFNVKGIHPHDVAHLLNEIAGVAIRSGHHCAQPMMTELGVRSTCRVSFYIYNQNEDIDILIEGLKSLGVVKIGIEDLYSDIILDYAKNSKYRKEIPASKKAEGKNLSCGDEITIL